MQLWLNTHLQTKLGHSTIIKMANFHTIKVGFGQNLLDIAIQEYGNWEAWRLVAEDNGIENFNAELVEGQELNIRTTATVDPDSEQRGATIDNPTVYGVLKPLGVVSNTAPIAGAFDDSFSMEFD